MINSQSQIKLNRRGLTEVVLACAFLSLLTFALWSWLATGGYVVAMEVPSLAPQDSLLPQLLHHPTIILTTVISEFILLLAITLALVPPAWWLRTDHILGINPEAAATPLRWLGQKIHQGHNQTETANSQYGVNAAGAPITYEQPGTTATSQNLAPGQQIAVPSKPVPGQMQPGQPIPGQMQPGQPVAGQMQPGQPVAGQMQPGQPFPGQPIPGQPIPGREQPGLSQPAAITSSAQPGQADVQQPVAPPAPTSDALNFNESEDDDPLADLASINDILSSAFDEDAGIDPDREALGRSLDEIDIIAVRTMARQVVATFIQ